jgi:hydrogenase maturation protease
VQLHSGVSGAATTARCRTLVAGFGCPGQRDLDFGEKFVRYAETLRWPAGVVVEDLSYAAHLVLHRLQELRPAKVVLVGAVSRGVDPPGTIRRYRLDAAPAAEDDVRSHLADAAAGEVDLDHTLAVARHWGGLPRDTVVAEVEAADCSFGLGFSEEVAAALDRLVEVVHEELAEPRFGEVPDQAGPGEALPDITQLFEYADALGQVRAQEALGGGLPDTPGLAIAGRFVPAGRALRTTGNWYDVVIPDHGVGLVMGDVAGRGLTAASEVAQLRTAVRTLALLGGQSPGRLVELLDRLVASTGMSETTLLYVSIHAGTGEVVFSNAGHCPPLLVTPGGGAEFVREGVSAPLGVKGRASTAETTLRLAPGSVLVLFTTGLVDGLLGAEGSGLQQIRRAVANGPKDVEKLCDHVLDSCASEPGDSDMCVLAVRLDP